MKEKFAMVAPDVQIEDGKGTILISSEEGETEGMMHCIYSLPSFGRRCLKERVHFSLSICYICYSVSQLKGATWSRRCPFQDSIALVGSQQFWFWELRVVSVSQ